MRRLIITAAAVLATLGPVLADGLLVPPHQAYPLPPPPQPSQSCLMTALQLGYLTGRREVAYSATEACIAVHGLTRCCAAVRLLRAVCADRLLGATRLAVAMSSAKSIPAGADHAALPQQRRRGQ